MTIIEYNLEPSPEGAKIPDFVINGGYWYNPDDLTLIGMVSDDDIPDTVTTYNLEELQVRQLAIHAKYPMLKNEKPVGTPIYESGYMTDDEVNAFVKSWVDMG